MNRERIIIRTSLTGIGANVFLAAFKVFAGIISGSIAVILDAVNNLSDALSSVITMIGASLAGKPADRKHPYGYGRAEYLSALSIALIVLYAGITSFAESVKKIITPSVPDYPVVTLVIISAGVLVKILLGRYVKKKGQEVNSASLINSGEDAVLDSVISFSTLAAALIFLKTGISLEAYLGLIISAVIIRSGIGMLKETLSRILGERAEPELSKNIKKDIASLDGVMGAYDLVLHDYGPDRYAGSVHAEVPDYMTAAEIDVLTRKIQAKIFEKYNVALTAVGFYAYNTTDEAAAELREKIRDIVESHEHVLQMHGFYADTENKTVRFDIVVSFKTENRKKLYQDICSELEKEFPEYEFTIVMDSDLSD